MNTNINFKPIFYVNGILLLILSAAMLGPMIIDLTNHSPDWKAFAGMQIITAFFGFSLLFVNRQEKFSMTLKETFLLTSLSWVFMAAFGALPFCFTEANLTYTDAFFEAMSGITTTGSTAIVGLDNLSHGILFWRAMLHWLGGIGFLIIALAILPLLQISGMQIFKTQSFDIEKIMPSASQMAIAILFIYIFLTFACAMFLYGAGMTVFEAFCHAMATLSTGGFSTSDGSIGHFNSAMIDIIIIVFMLLGGLPFVLYLKALKGSLKSLLNDGQVQSFIGTVLFFTAMLTAYLMVTNQFGLFTALRHSAFKVVTLMTTTGYATQDYTLWGPFAISIAFLLTFLGSCSGSTAGGIKIFRLQILWSMLKQQLNRLLVPNGIFQVHYNHKPIDATVQISVGVFFFVYLASFILFGMLLMLTGLEFVTAFSGSVTALSNVGPGLGATIGPVGNFSTLAPSSIWVLSAAMLLGRLEFFTLLVLFLPRFWKD